MKAALEAAGYTVDVRSATANDITIYSASGDIDADGNQNY